MHVIWAIQRDAAARGVRERPQRDTTTSWGTAAFLVLEAAAAELVQQRAENKRLRETWQPPPFDAPTFGAAAFEAAAGGDDDEDLYM